MVHGKPATASANLPVQFVRVRLSANGVAPFLPYRRERKHLMSVATPTAIAASPTSFPARIRVAVIALAAALSAALVATLLHRLAGGGILFPQGRNAWLLVHLLSVVPAVPLGAYVLIRRKGGRLHRLLGRTWALMMLAAALSSLGMHGLTGGFSWIHLLSLLVLVSIPRAVIAAIRGNIAAHQQGMTMVYAGLVIAGFFTFLPGRLLGIWMFG
jgi:uncharacterized membrane protein